ncbi:MAG TPA: hypothetical protein VM364_11465 [Vicinamibacterales bacterium]|nr:hypothetical protein [Vicinamibacterales bacterium]
MIRACYRTAVLSAVALLPLAGCEAKKSSNPLSPAVAGPIAGVSITAPQLLEPAQGTRLKDSQQPIRLVIGNSSSTGVRPVAYTFEVSTENSFATKAYARTGVLPGADGRTFVVVERLDAGRDYYWRVRAEDGANSSEFATSNFAILPKPQLDPPAMHQPANNAQIASRRPELIVGVSTRNAAIGNVVYDFQISSDVAFSNIVSAGKRSEAGATTTYAPDGDLAAATTFHWRVRASDGEFTSQWSTVQSFRTPAAPAPGPAPGPSPGPTNPGGPCDSSNPDWIVQCERAKYGYMDRNQILDFLRATARSLNRNNIGGGPYGILRKTSGNQCNGYSCDIICAGQGTAQRQHDVLVDVEHTQGAGWGPPHVWPNIRVDVCDIQ